MHSIERLIIVCYRVAVVDMSQGDSQRSIRNYFITEEGPVSKRSKLDVEVTTRTQTKVITTAA